MSYKDLTKEAQNNREKNQTKQFFTEMQMHIKFAA